MELTYDRLSRTGIDGFGHPAWYVRSIHCDEVRRKAAVSNYFCPDYFCYVLSAIGASSIYIGQAAGVLHPGFKI